MRRIAAVLSIVAALGGMLWLLWIFGVRHADLPRGESGLIALAAAGVIGCVVFGIGVLLGIAGLFSVPSRPWAVIGIVLNAAPLILIAIMAVR